MLFHSFQISHTLTYQMRCIIEFCIMGLTIKSHLMLSIKHTNYSRDFIILKQNKINKEVSYYYIYSQYIFISISWYKVKHNQYRLAIRAYSNNPDSLDLIPKSNGFKKDKRLALPPICKPKYTKGREPTLQFNINAASDNQEPSTFKSYLKVFFVTLSFFKKNCNS